MTINEFDKVYDEILAKIETGSLVEAFDSMRHLAKMADLNAYEQRIDNLEQAYFYFHRMLAGNAPFPNASEESDRIAAQITELVAKMWREVSAQNGDSLYGSQLRFQALRPEETAESLIADYYDEYSRLGTDMRALTDTGTRRRLEQLANDIFMRIWTMDTLTADEAQTLSNVLSDSDIPVYDRLMWIAALGLSPFDDVRRYELLYALYSDTNERISVVAFIWLCFAALVSRNEDSEACKLVNKIAKQKPQDAIIFMLEYECVFAEHNDSIEYTLPMASFGPLAGMPTSGIDTDPAQFLEKIQASMPEGSIEKLKEFQNAQMRGDDVFVGTIGRMRHFSLFRNLSAWFLPFHMERSELAPIVDTEGAGVASIMEKMPMLCDSDKYALLLSLSDVPESMRAEMLANTYMSFSQLSGSEEGAEMMKSLDAKPTRRSLMNNYLKNLVRLRRYFTRSKELSLPGDDSNLGELFDWKKVSPALKEFQYLVDELVRKERFNVAAELIDQNTIGTNNVERIQRNARIYAKVGRYSSALTYLLEKRQDGENSIETAIDFIEYWLKADNMVRAGNIIWAYDLASNLYDNVDDDKHQLEVLADFALEVGQFDRASNMMLHVYYLHSDPSIKLSIKTAETLAITSDWQSVTDVLQPLKEANVENVSAKGRMRLFNLLGLAYWQADNRQAALDCFKRAIKSTDTFSKWHTAFATFCSELIVKSKNPNVVNPSAALIPDLAGYAVKGSKFGSF